ncbi:DUF6566 family protein [Ralstonia pseudosolanacearum]|nr:DUF6566 family protein [Ralstonia pseudosolanacearum]
MTIEVASLYCMDIQYSMGGKRPGAGAVRFSCRPVRTLRREYRVRARFLRPGHIAMKTSPSPNPAAAGPASDPEAAGDGQVAFEQLHEYRNHTITIRPRRIGGGLWRAAFAVSLDSRALVAVGTEVGQAFRTPIGAARDAVDAARSFIDARLKACRPA